MFAILKRELRSYFSSPIGYVCVACLAALYGLFFFMVMQMGSSSYVSYVYSSMFMFCMMIIPIITMKSMSEDKKNKTDQSLLTAPVGVFGIVLGKFLGAFGVYFIATTISHFPAIAMNFFSTPPWGLIFGNYLAVLLYGAAMISIGVFISSLTESQIISAIATFAVSMILIYLDTIASVIANTFIQNLLYSLSFASRYNVFSTGIFSFSSAIFFLSITAVFIFLTARKLESRRWN